MFNGIQFVHDFGQQRYQEPAQGLCLFVIVLVLHIRRKRLYHSPQVVHAPLYALGRLGWPIIM